MSVILGLVFLAFGFGAGYEVGDTGHEDLGCDTVVRTVVADYAKDNMKLVNGQSFSDGFSLAFADTSTMRVTLNLFAATGPDEANAASWTAAESCITAQGLKLTRYVGAEQKPSAD